MIFRCLDRKTEAFDVVAIRNAAGPVRNTDSCEVRDSASIANNASTLRSESDNNRSSWVGRQRKWGVHAFNQIFVRRTTRCNMQDAIYLVNWTFFVVGVVESFKLTSFAIFFKSGRINVNFQYEETFVTRVMNGRWTRQIESRASESMTDPICYIAFLPFFVLRVLSVVFSTSYRSSAIPSVSHSFSLRSSLPFLYSFNLTFK